MDLKREDMESRDGGVNFLVFLESAGQRHTLGQLSGDDFILADVQFVFNDGFP